MAKREIKVGSTDQTEDILILDSSSSTGAGLTGLEFDTTDLTCYYRKGAAGVPTPLTLATQTINGAHANGGFVEADATNCPGLYRLDYSDVMLDTLGILKVYLQGAANMAPCVFEIEVVGVDKYDAMRNGMGALPNAEAQAAGGLYTRGSGAGQIAQDANGRINVNVKALADSDDAANKARDGWNGLSTIGTAQAGGPSTITLEAGASSEPNFYKDQACAIVEGTGAGQVGRITASDGATKVATVSVPWVVEPDNTSKYWLIGRIE